MKKRFFSLLTLLVLAGCAVTHFQGITNNVVAGKHYQKIIVHSDLADMENRKTIEDAVVRQFKAIGVDATASYTVFPNGTSLTWEEKKVIIRTSGFDAGLLVKVVDSYSTNSAKNFTGHDLPEVSLTPTPSNTPNPNPPPVFTPIPTPTIGYQSVFDAQIIHHMHKDPSDWGQTGNPWGDSFYTAHFKIETRLVETKDFQPVWQALSNSKEGMDASGNFSLLNIMKSYALTLVDELEREGIVTAAMNLESIRR